MILGLFMNCKILLIISCALAVQFTQAKEAPTTPPQPESPATPAEAPAPAHPMDPDSLHLFAVEALMSVDSERALPLALKVLSGASNDELKSRVLFVISQMDVPEAHAVLLETAKSSKGQLREDAIQMIGIGGDPDALAGLASIYHNGNDDDKSSVLSAYLIADDSQAVFDIAANAKNEQEFEQAVHILGAMDATHLLRKLGEEGRYGESLIQALAIAGDTESLRKMALDASKPEQQLAAIQGLGIAGEGEADSTLLDIYRTTNNPEVKDAARRGLMISGNSKAIVLLFNESKDDAEKSALLRILTQIDDEAALRLIESTLLPL